VPSKTVRVHVTLPHDPEPDGHSTKRPFLLVMSGLSCAGVRYLMREDRRRLKKVPTHSKSAALASWRVPNRVRWTISVCKAPQKLSLAALSNRFPFRLIEGAMRVDREQLLVFAASGLEAPVTLADQAVRGELHRRSQGRSVSDLRPQIILCPIHSASISRLFRNAAVFICACIQFEFSISASAGTFSPKSSAASDIF